MGVGVNYLLIHQMPEPYWIKGLPSNWQCGGQGFESPTLHQPPRPLKHLENQGFTVFSVFCEVRFIGQAKCEN